MQMSPPFNSVGKSLLSIRGEISRIKASLSNVVLFLLFISQNHYLLDHDQIPTDLPLLLSVNTVGIAF